MAFGTTTQVLPKNGIVQCRDFGTELGYAQSASFQTRIISYHITIIKSRGGFVKKETSSTISRIILGKNIIMENSGCTFLIASRSIIRKISNKHTI